MLIDAVLDHLGTEETDLNGRVRFLTTVMGHRVLRRGTHVVTGRPIVMLADPSGMKLELMEVDELRGELDHVAYRVDDVETAHSELLGTGCIELRPPFDLVAAHARSSLVREPTGARLQLISYAPDSPDLTQQFPYKEVDT